MNIHHCFNLDFDLETARFQPVKNRNADKRFLSNNSQPTHFTHNKALQMFCDTKI